MDTQASDATYAADGAKAQTAGPGYRKDLFKNGANKPQTAEDCSIGNKQKSRNRHLKHFAQCVPHSVENSNGFTGSPVSLKEPSQFTNNNVMSGINQNGSISENLTFDPNHPNQQQLASHYMAQRRPKIDKQNVTQIL
jgi:hypothetical protein